MLANGNAKKVSKTIGEGSVVSAECIDLLDLFIDAPNTEEVENMINNVITRLTPWNMLGNE